MAEKYQPSEKARKIVSKIKELDTDFPKEGMLQFFIRTDDDSYMYDELSGFAHKMLGYPAFTQEDPREGMSEEDAQHFDTLLLQIDSDMGEDRNDYVLWGDCGIGNFFINCEALKNFDRVLYNWDCC